MKITQVKITCDRCGADRANAGDTADDAIHEWKEIGIRYPGCVERVADLCGPCVKALHTWIRKPINAIGVAS